MDEAPQPDSHDHEHHGRGGDPPRVVQDGGQGPLVARGQGVEPPLHPGERARLHCLHLVHGDEPLGE